MLLSENHSREMILQIKGMVASVPAYLETTLHDIELVVAER
jgi:hypothetical protein